MTIKQLKQLFLEKTNDTRDIQAISFMLNDEILDDDYKTVSSYAITDNSILQVVDLNATVRGSFSSLGLKFVDISDNKCLKRVDWSKTASSWRISTPGLCLERICANSQCKAYGQHVVMPIGYGTFDILTDTDETTTKCPMCSTYVEPITCSFNNCWWRYRGIKQVANGAPPRKCSNEWQRADNAYHYFDQSQSGVVSWKQLIVEAVKNRPYE